MSADPRFGQLQLGSLALFAGLDELTLEHIKARLQVQWLAAGTELFKQGDEADALYILVSGALAVLLEPAHAALKQRWIGRVFAGETVGEMAMLSGKPRSATVRALRDSEVLRFARADFEALMATEAAAMLHIARVAFQRLENSFEANQIAKSAKARTFAILPLSEFRDDQVHAFASMLAEELSRFGATSIVREHDHRESTSDDFHRLEQAHRYLLYVSTQRSGHWHALCRRQVDEVLFLIDGDLAVEHARADAPLDVLKQERLVLHFDAERITGKAKAWRALLPGRPHHHVRFAHAPEGHQSYRSDVERLGRFLTGNATGLVLGGGGARGFAHLGVIRALREYGLQIDATGGTSIGAVIAAGVALEWSDEELYQRYHRSFVQKNPLNDYTLPVISLVAGRKATQRLREEYDTWQVEDMVLPYYCVSTNLTRGISKVHTEGPVWLGLRASIAIPGILPPVFHQGDVLVDGGVINNLPVDVMRNHIFSSHECGEQSSAGRIIGVDIAGDYAIRTSVEEADLPSIWRMGADWLKDRTLRPSILQILLRSGMVNSATTAEQNRRNTDWLIKPPVEQVELLAWKSFDRAIELGYQHTVKLLDSGELFGAQPRD